MWLLPKIHPNEALDAKTFPRYNTIPYSILVIAYNNTQVISLFA